MSCKFCRFQCPYIKYYTQKIFLFKFHSPPCLQNFPYQEFFPLWYVWYPAWFTSWSVEHGPADIEHVILLSATNSELLDVALLFMCSGIPCGHPTSHPPKQPSLQQQEAPHWKWLCYHCLQRFWPAILLWNNQGSCSFIISKSWWLNCLIHFRASLTMQRCKWIHCLKALIVWLYQCALDCKGCLTPSPAWSQTSGYPSWSGKRHCLPMCVRASPLTCENGYYDLKPLFSTVGFLGLA